MLKERDGRSVAKKLPGGIEIEHFPEPDEPLLAQSYDLSEYQAVADRVKKQIGNISVLIDGAPFEKST